MSCKIIIDQSLTDAIQENIDSLCGVGVQDFLGPGAILISAFGAWWFASKAIKNAREISRKKSTFDYLTKLSWDGDYIEARQRFITIKIGPKKLRAIAADYEKLKINGHADAPPDGDDDALRTIQDHGAIKNILNEYEALAVAVRSEALDEGMVRLFQFGQLARAKSSAVGSRPPPFVPVDFGAVYPVEYLTHFFNQALCDPGVHRLYSFSARDSNHRIALVGVL